MNIFSTVLAKDSDISIKKQSKKLCFIYILKSNQKNYVLFINKHVYL